MLPSLLFLRRGGVWNGDSRCGRFLSSLHDNRIWGLFAFRAMKNVGDLLWCWTRHFRAPGLLGVGSGSANHLRSWAVIWRSVVRILLEVRDGLFFGENSAAFLQCVRGASTYDKVWKIGVDISGSGNDGAAERTDLSKLMSSTTRAQHMPHTTTRHAETLIAKVLAREGRRGRTIMVFVM